MLPLHTPHERRPHATNLFALVAQLAQQISCKDPFVGSTPTQSSIGASSNWNRRLGFQPINADSSSVAPPIHHLHSSSSAAEQLLYTEMREGASPSWSTTWNFGRVRFIAPASKAGGPSRGPWVQIRTGSSTSRTSSIVEHSTDNREVVGASPTSWSNSSGTRS
jgi:hypothetical protein